MAVAGKGVSTVPVGFFFLMILLLLQNLEAISLLVWQSLYVAFFNVYSFVRQFDYLYVSF